MTLRAGFNPTVVTLGTMLLGVAAGIVGVFAVLRKRALLCDALSHATLPGICIAFLIAAGMGWQERSLAVLLAGAAVSAVLGLLAVHFIRTSTRLADDAAIGIVLSVFFGAGVVLLSLIQTVETGNQGGLKSIIYGQTAAMHSRDAMFMAVLAVTAAGLAAAFIKELALVCFDETFAKVGGWPVGAVDLLTMTLVVIVTVAGLQAVGLILVIALLIIPPAAARLWTDRLFPMLLLSAIIGGLSGYLGSIASYLLPRLPAGSVIVLVAGAIFVVSLCCAPQRGLIAGAARRLSIAWRVRRDHLLRELVEHPGGLDASSLADRGHRSLGGLVLRHLARARLARRNETGAWVLTEAGRVEGLRLLRAHRLWEQYLIRHAQVASSHVDWSLDTLEHVLSPALIAELEDALREETTKIID